MDIDINAIRKEIENGAIEKKDIWENLLQILSNENSKLGHYFFRNGDFEADSLVGKIQNKADLPDEAFTKLLSSLSSKPFWNESMSSALSYFLKHFKINDKTESIPGIAAVTYEDIYNADAGATFDPLKKFVIPWKNIDDKDYKTVRSGDEIDAVIASDKKLQFTHKGDKNWIRLIMPEYERFVEIEDLDRNFWVIGQVISAISAYLFDDDGPMKNLLSNIMQELVELWENILYLWVALALYDNRKYTDVHVEAAYVPNDELQSQFKYDNFSGTPSWSDICNRFAHKIQDYPESNLIIIPIRRKGNYEHNYYRTERYPGILFYDRNNPLDNDLTKGFRILAFQKEVSEKRIDTGDVKVEDFKNSVYAAKDNENGTLNVIFPYANAKIKTEFVPSLYYGAIRTIIDFPSTSWSYDVEQGFTFKSFSLTCYDAIAEAISISGTPVPVGTKKLEEDIVINTATPAKTGDGDDQRILAELTLKPETGISGKTADGVKLKKGYYLGELASDGVLTKEISYDIHEDSISMPPITTNDPGTDYHDARKTFYQDILKVENDIRTKNISILEQYYDIVDSKPDDEIRLLVGTRPFDLYKAGDDNWTSTEKAQEIVDATSIDGLGGYYTTDGTNSLYTRGQLSPGTIYAHILYDKSIEESLGNRYQDFDNQYSKRDEYLLPYSIYSEININDDTFSANKIDKNANAFSTDLTDTGTTDDERFLNSLVKRYNTTKFTGTHGGRIDLGAKLIIPGLSSVQYNNYRGFKVLPTFINYDDEGDGLYGIWLQGETGSPTRHTWNDTTTMTYCKGEQLTQNNWCIVYITTYGGYAPAGKLDTEVDKVAGVPAITGYESKNKQKSGSFKPIIFATHVHIFLPNQVYARKSTEFWKYDGAVSNRATLVEDNFSWNASGKVSYYNQSKFNEIAPLIGIEVDSTVNGYTCKKWISKYTQYKLVNNKYKRSTKKGTTAAERYDFYNKPHTGR